MRRGLITAVITVLVISLTIAVWYINIISNQFNTLLNSMESHARLDLIMLSDNLNELTYLTSINVSHGLIAYKLETAFSHTRVLEFTSWTLYKYSGNKKLYLLHIAFSNLETYIIDVMNDHPNKLINRITKNADILTKISAILKDIHKNGGLRSTPNDIINELVNLTRVITYH